MSGKQLSTVSHRFSNPKECYKRQPLLILQSYYERIKTKAIRVADTKLELKEPVSLTRSLQTLSICCFGSCCCYRRSEHLIFKKTVAIMHSPYPNRSMPPSPATSVLQPVFTRPSSLPTSQATSILRSAYPLPPSIPTSPASSVLHPAYQSPPTHPNTLLHSFRQQGFQDDSSPLIQILHPAALDVLQRVEAQSAVDVESYVKALGDKKYSSVKESRREALLKRFGASANGAQLDDATVRRVTNLASAEASRAKKEFILDELQSQLKKRSADAVVLAAELRKTMSHLEQVGNSNRQIEFQLQQRQYTYGPVVAQPRMPLGGQMNTQISSWEVTNGTAGAGMFTGESHQASGQNHIMHVPSPIDIQEDRDQSDYSSVMDEDYDQNRCPPTPATMMTTTTDCGLSPAPNSFCDSMHDFCVEGSTKMATQTCPRALAIPYEANDTKIGGLEGNISPMQQDIAESLQLSVSNSCDQFTVAG